VTAQALIDALRARGIHLRVVNGRTACRPGRLLTPDLRERVRELSVEMAAILKTAHEADLERVCGPTLALDAETVATGPGTACCSCRSTTWWRLRPGHEWICHRCHPPESSDVEVADRPRRSLDETLDEACGQDPGVAHG